MWDTIKQPKWQIFMVTLAIALGALTFYLFQKYAVGEVIKGLGPILVFFSGLMSILHWWKGIKKVKEQTNHFLKDGQYILVLAIFFIFISIIFSLALLFKIFITGLFPENITSLSLVLGSFGLVLMLVSLPKFFKNK